jgi:hypothetical protein
VRKIKIFFNMSLNILNKVDTLEGLIKEIRDSLNSQKVRKENVNDTNQKKIHELLLKQERQNEWYDEFLKLKKNYNEEYLKHKQSEDDERKYKNVYMSIPYISLSSLNVNDYINKSLTVTQEKAKQRVQPKYKFTSKEKNINTKQFKECSIKKY